MRYPFRRNLLIAIVIVSAAVFTFVLVQRSQSATIALTTFTEADVRVDLSLEQRVDGQIILAAQYTPLREQFHVYSKNLPPNGLDGLGRPTRLAVMNGLQAIGELSANLPTIDQKIDGLDEIFPVYPDGPVVLRLPIKVVGDGSGQVKVSYMACSSNFGCMPPIEKILNITAPR